MQSFAMCLTSVLQPDSVSTTRDLMNDMLHLVMSVEDRIVCMESANKTVSEGSFITRSFNLPYKAQNLQASLYGS